MAGSGRAAAHSFGDRLEFRPEQAEDEGFLRRLYASTRAGEMALTGWEQAQIDAFLEMQFDLQRAHFRQHFSDASFQAVLLDGRPIGRLYVRYGPRETHLMDIALLPEFRGKGFGGWMVRNLLDAATHSRTPVTLYVEPYNRALRLYKRAGFLVVERSDTNLFMEWRPEDVHADAPRAMTP
jgi:ribosomal protein S18 acetylase RimI-like enzyme